MVFALAALTPARAADSLERGFRNPPHAAKPWVYWFWMDGNLSRDGITADLEAMQRAGLGGMIIMEVDVGVPRGPVQFMSEAWRALFKHAVLEAERLGLEITLNAGPGWTGSGGPWVKPEQSMQHLVASQTNVAGGRRFEGPLPRPAPRARHFVHGALPPPMEQAKNEFYRDVAVLAFPAVTGENRIADIDEKALYYRNPYSSTPGVKPYLPAPASYPETPAGMAIARDRVVDLSDRLEADGRLMWDVPAGNWTILRLGRTSTGANTRPAPVPGIGLECDKFDRAALEAHYEAFVGTLLREIGPRPTTRTAGWTMLHIDSWEMGAQNWTASFREEFRRRRGYDPLPYLPAVTGRVIESLEVSERFLWDLRQTAQELVVENHADHLKTLGRRDGFRLSIEPYDMNPCSDLSLGGVADIPMCEFWALGGPFNTTFSCIESASIAHTRGRPILAAEAFTGGAPWHFHPGNLKEQADWAFGIGINRLVVHRYAHQPWLDRWPGMTMESIGIQYERTQTWWDLVEAWHAYLARCQFLLQRGLPVADICYLAAEGAPHVFRPPPSALRGPPLLPDRRGYNFDGCAPETVLRDMTVKDGQLVLPDGMSYRVLVLPELQTMTPALLRKVRDLVDAGATVIGPPPIKSPSLSDYPQCDDEVKKLATELWGPYGVPASAGPTFNSPGGTTFTERRFGKGRVLARGDLANVQAASPATTLAAAKARWIWHREGNPAVAAPRGSRHFRRRLNLEPGAAVESARLLMTADNGFQARVNGKPAGEGDNFHVVYSLDVTPLLGPGTNLVTVVADNGGEQPNPAGLIGTLEIRLRDGRTLGFPTGPDWESAESENGVPQAALDLGPLGMGPWGRIGQEEVRALYGDYEPLTEVLARMGVPPDFESDGPLRYLHRRDGQTDIYFVANRENRWVEARCLFRVTDKSPALWDPVFGRLLAPDTVEPQDGRTRLTLSLEPHGSVFVVFQPGAPPVATKAEPLFPKLRQLADITGPWEVRFQPNRGAPDRITLDPLIDWARHADEGVRHFSGIATYRKTFHLPPSATQPPPAPVVLDLGRVQVMARVSVNGRPLGVVWKTPFRLDITSAVKPGENDLEIAVANLWPNRLIGDAALPAAQRVTWTTFNPFKKDTPLLESGLLGPVTLQMPAGRE